MTLQSRPYVDFQELKQVVPLEHVLEVFGILDRFVRTGHTLTGVCPLPQHQHSMHPNPQQFKIDCHKNLFFCHGDCKRGGDVVEFVKLMTGLDNSHVRFWFAEQEELRTRLTLTKPRQSSERQPPKKEARDVVQTPQRAKAKESNYEVSPEESPIKPLRFKLKLQSPVPYLRQRGVSDTVAERYGLGLCTKGILKDFVAIPIYRCPKDRYPVSYLGRLPCDDSERTVDQPRYKWPAGFPKQLIVYGLAEALETPANGPLIVVEGPFSVYHLAQAGFPATVAIFGSSLSDEQAEQIAESGRNVMLLFDGDEAGRTGAAAAASKLITRTSVRLITLQDGYQPDQLSPAEVAKILY